MTHFLILLCMLGHFPKAWTQCPSGFYLDGDFMIGGLFDIHYLSEAVKLSRPEAIDCASHPFSVSSYRRFQLMRFSIEEINNSSFILPNISLGYEIFDHCSDALNFPSIFKLLSVNGSIQPWAKPHKAGYKVIGVVGPFTSTQAMSVAPLLMPELIPMVNYGSSSSGFSNKGRYPSFFRTVNPNRDVIDVIVAMLQHFNWSWVAFLHSDDNYGNDGLELFKTKIRDTEICLGYTDELETNTNFSQMFKSIEGLRINVIIVFAPELPAEGVIKSAVQLKVTNKVWIAGDTWSLNKRLQKMSGIKKIGTVLGLSQPVITIAGFRDFINSTKMGSRFCTPQSNCSQMSAQDVIDADPSYSFPVYSAVYAIAHALHKVLRCGTEGCKDIRVHPNMVVAELKKSNFALLNQTIRFDEYGDLSSGLLSLVFWNNSGVTENIGSYQFHPTVNFCISGSKITWHGDGKVPTSTCSQKCPPGHARNLNRIHRCCFTCERCPKGTYINVTDDPFNCIGCDNTEWSEEGSTLCTLRLLEYVHFSDTSAVAIMASAWILLGLMFSVSILFAVNYNTPIVRSAGGPMCFLILACLSLSCISVFFYFDKPTPASCILRYLPFILFFTVCLASFAVRSFQIVCIFKISAKFPSLHIWWMKYHAQWLLIIAVFATQGILLASFSSDPPRPYNETSWYPEQIVLFCYLNLNATACSLMLPSTLSCLCFIFSYVGKDLPKNYNEAKAITFCLLLVISTWVVFITVYTLYHGKHIQTLNAIAVLSSLYSFLIWYFLPKCYIILFQPSKNTQQYFQTLIQSYTKTISQ